MRVKVYDHKNQDWEMKCKIEEYKQGNITNIRDNKTQRDQSTQ